MDTNIEIVSTTCKYVNLNGNLIIICPAPFCIQITEPYQYYFENFGASTERAARFSLYKKKVEPEQNRYSICSITEPNPIQILESRIHHEPYKPTKMSQFLQVHDHEVTHHQRRSDEMTKNKGIDA